MDVIFLLQVLEKEPPLLPELVVFLKRIILILEVSDLNFLIRNELYCESVLLFQLDVARGQPLDFLVLVDKLENVMVQDLIVITLGSILDKRLDPGNARRELVD